MFYKLYKVQYKDRIPDNNRFKEFENFYKENGVDVVGGWENVEKSNELLFMTGYKDEGHYTKFVASMKENTRYQELTSQLNMEREHVEVSTWRSAPDM
ncbi:MAG: hypothetical protein ACXAD7_28870 [Candidatus Kariarchaeaceae archaeon]